MEKNEVTKIVEFIKLHKKKGDHKKVAKRVKCSVNTVYSSLKTRNSSDLSLKIFESFVFILKTRLNKKIDISQNL